ncbi:hypothetical protein [Hymenobacter rubripertinctus]|uniref:Uncharacterized protein n=1 Tax=Hymenobacter rubripertinctus TaxID=2029981 RepID=A0A418R0V6_9BACT|nr:hypothetical protein [Hymenobacter rubripertinctus]RIY11031.1 hypothetical protein D0T11_08460 [Hymenobacter rubripertinctus]
MLTFLLLLGTHLTATLLGLGLLRRLFPQPFQHPQSVADALRDPPFRALLALGIVLPFWLAQIANAGLFDLAYSSGRYTWTLGVHLAVSIFYYQASLRTAARRKRS